MILRFWRVVRLWHGFNEQRAKKGHMMEHLKHLHHENETMKEWVRKRYGKAAAAEMELIVEMHADDHGEGGGSHGHGSGEDVDYDQEHGHKDDNDKSFLPEGVEGIDNVEDVEGAHIEGQAPKANGHDNGTNGK